MDIQYINSYDVFPPPAEATAFFLYSVIDNMSEQDVQAQEDKLRKFFNQLKTQVHTLKHTQSMMRLLKTHTHTHTHHTFIHNISSSFITFPLL